MKVNDGNHDLIVEVLEEQADNVKESKGNFWLEMISGHTNGMTHRMGWAWELGTDWFTEKDPKGTELFSIVSTTTPSPLVHDLKQPPAVAAVLKNPDLPRKRLHAGPGSR